MTELEALLMVPLVVTHFFKIQANQCNFYVEKVVNFKRTIMNKGTRTPSLFSLLTVRCQEPGSQQQQRTHKISNMNDSSSTSEKGKQTCCPVRQSLERHMYHRSASLTDVEKSFLHSLLIDEPPTLEEEDLHKKKIESASEALTDDILFSVPLNESSEDGSDSNRNVERKRSMPPKPTRSNPQLGECLS